MVKICAVGECKNRSSYFGSSELSFYKFPSHAVNPKRRAEWARLCGRKDLTTGKAWAPKETVRSVYICSVHFISGRPCTDRTVPSDPDYLPTLFLPGYQELDAEEAKTKRERTIHRPTVCNFVCKPLQVIRKVPRPIRDHIRSGMPVIPKEDRDMLEECTREQAASMIWHEQRCGRITSSIVHDILHTNKECPSKSLLLKICSVRPRPLNVPELKWGREHESGAINVYKETMSTSHVNFAYRRSGLHLHPQHTEFATSPDGLVKCDCCGKGTLEVKCPYTLKDVDLSLWPTISAYALDENNQMRESHQHYSQIQHHMFVTGYTYCDYVVWSPKGYIIARVQKDEQYPQVTVPKLKMFWKMHIREELTSGALQRAEIERQERAKKNQVFCTCGKPEGNLPMVGCDNSECPHQWYHLKCLGMKTTPRTKTWYCQVCRPSSTAKRRKVKK